MIIHSSVEIYTNSENLDEIFICQMVPENKGNIKKIQKLTLCWFVFLEALLRTTECSVLHLNFLPHFLKHTLKTDDKAAFLCQMKHIHHSAQSN